MKYVVKVVSAEEEQIELFSSDDKQLAEGAKIGALALLDLFKDDMELEDGYDIVMSDEHSTSSNESSEDRYRLNL